MTAAPVPAPGSPARQPNSPLPSAFAAPWRAIGRRAVRFWQRGDPGALLIVIALLTLPAVALGNVLTVQPSAVYWPISLNQLPIVSLFAVLFGYLLARSRYNELLSMFVSGLYSVAVIGVIQVFDAPGTLTQRLVGIVNRLLDSVSQLQHGAASDPFLLVIFLSLLFWSLAHNTVWHIFRVDRVWRAIIPPALVLVINGLYSASNINLDLYLIAYIFLALLLVVRSHLNALEYEWYERQVAFDSRLRRRFYQIGAVLSVVILLLAWLLPTGSNTQNQNRFQEFLNGDLLNQLNKTWSRLLTPLDSITATASDYYGRDSLQLTGGVQLGDQIVMTVSVPSSPTNSRFYWQSRVFDTYQNSTWHSDHTNQVSSPSPLNLNQPGYFPGERQDVAQTFTVQSMPSDLIYAAPAARQIQLSATAEVNIIDPQTGAVDVTDIRPTTILQTGTTYTAISSVSTASADQLRAASLEHPAWLNPDLQLDPSVAPKTQKMADQIIQQAHAVTPYDKAKAIESWLRENVAYDINVTNPPANVDPIDWSIFTIKKGYCTYYASAMIVMLRKLLIPARMAAGFAQGVYDPVAHQYVVREKDAHTWVQAYFPGAGWVEFEPTAAQPSLNRNNDNGVPPTPTPSPTPLPTDTSTPQASEQVSPTTAGQSSAPTQPPPIISATPTETTTPEADMTPPPLLPLPSLPPQIGGLLALGGIAALLIGIVSFMVIGMLWWFEYRGLGNLSPIARAYARLLIYMRWLRFGTPPGATPLERGRFWMRKAPEQAASIGAITDLYISERYAAPRPRTEAEESRANMAWRVARGGFLTRKIRSWLPRFLRGPDPDQPPKE